MFVMCNLVDGYIEANSFSYQFRYSISNTIAFNIPLRYPYNICISRKWNRMHHNQSTLNCTTTHQTHDHIENLQKNYNFFKWNWVGILCDRHFKPIHIHTQRIAHTKQPEETDIYLYAVHMVLRYEFMVNSLY